MKKIVLTDEVVQSLNFLIEATKSHYGSINSHVFQPHLEKVSKAVVDEEQKPEEQVG